MINKQYIRYLVFVLIFLISINADSKETTNRSMPIAKKGVINLANWNFINDGSVILNGEWEFYWNTLLSPSDFPTSLKPLYPQFPQLWNSMTFDSLEIKSTGYATYRLTLINCPDDILLALKVPSFYDEYKLWLNGSVFTENGKVGTSKDESEPYWLPITKSINSKNDTIELVLQVSNYSHSKGVTSLSIEIGDSQKLYKHREKELSTTLLLTGALIMGGLFFLGLFMFGRQNKAVLYFSLFCIVYSYRIIGTDMYFLHSILPPINLEITTRLEYLTLFLSVFLFMRFLEILYPQETSKIMANFLKITSLILVLSTLLLPSRIFTLSIDPFLVVLVIYVIYGTYIIVNANRHKLGGSHFAIISFLFLFIVITLQVFNYLGYLPHLPFVYFIGYILFFFFQSLILSYRFAMYFRTATDKAEMGARAKADFMATMSHEIRTPMNGVIGMTGLLQQTNLTREQQEFVDTIRISGENLLTVINDILDFSKIEQGKMELEKHSFDLFNSIEEVMSMLSTNASKKGLEILFRKDPDVPRFILKDEQRLKQILVNLINNAIKFTIKGEVVLDVSVRKKDGKFYELLFKIIDTGIGIPKEKMNRLFQSFSQVDSSIARRFEGTGLGLAISKKLVNLMSGEIWVESEINKGSTFSFTIFVEQDTEEGENIFTTNQTTFKGKHAIILDDNHTNLKILSSQLENWGIEVSMGSDCNEILAFIRQKKYDFAIIDMQMPDINGIEVASKIKELDNGKDLPIIILSSIKVEFTEEEKKLFNNYILKPAREISLWKALEDVVGSKKVQVKVLKKTQKILTRFDGVNLLVAEDNLINQKVTTSLLNKFGIHPDIAANGLLAFEASQKKDYHLVLMDVQMPEMDGLEATEKILKYYKQENKKPPIILAMTANVLGESKQQCLNAGMLGFISKPVSPTELQERLKKWLNDFMIID
ncbi:MAG: hypothetical protein C0598_05380 [Marinilabiliales bacterium]|nr:MAG: hypothetical protein C0598_05380 [Marinilabiliales bacterium]